MKEGLRCSGAIPYGYKRINGDKQTLVVDEPAAEIVRKVFRLACQGMGVTAIAEQLTEEKVLIPSAYTAKYFPENCRNRSFSDPYRWNANTIGHMEIIVPQLAKAYGVTEQLKAENQIEWVRQMNACVAQAEEAIKGELIYC